jgi:hypothetical protein
MSEGGQGFAPSVKAKSVSDSLTQMMCESLIAEGLAFLKTTIGGQKTPHFAIAAHVWKPLGFILRQFQESLVESAISASNWDVRHGFRRDSQPR